MLNSGSFLLLNESAHNPEMVRLGVANIAVCPSAPHLHDLRTVLSEQLCQPPGVRVKLPAWLECVALENHADNVTWRYVHVHSYLYSACVSHVGWGSGSSPHCTGGTVSLVAFIQHEPTKKVWGLGIDTCTAIYGTGAVMRHFMFVQTHALFPTVRLTSVRLSPKQRNRGISLRHGRNLVRFAVAIKPRRSDQLSAFTRGSRMALVTCDRAEIKTHMFTLRFMRYHNPRQN